jgi:hypothetical protein
MAPERVLPRFNSVVWSTTSKQLSLDRTVFEDRVEPAILIFNCRAQVQASTLMDTSKLVSLIGEMVGERIRSEFIP